MTVAEAIATRRSVRKYDSRPVDETLLREVLEAARISPSAANGQNWRFILVRDPAILAKLAVAADNQPSMIEAPAAIVALATASRDMSCGQPTSTVDCSIAMSYLILRAHELGLGTCWLGRFFADKVRDALAIPDDAVIVAMTPIGYPAETPDARPRKAFDEVVSFDKY
ncbi:MAG: nitroreductase family protein [Oscillospiraceae bacterium]|jgi:nitroreductase|nr:nitroreductase family protein [Oscillospiraceae bacterium]